MTENDGEYLATNEVRMRILMRLKYATTNWIIETYHRDIEKLYGIERCQDRYENLQRNLSLLAFIRLGFVNCISFFKAKIFIVIEAVISLFGKADLYD